jgi:hypothetical protein
LKICKELSGFSNFAKHRKLVQIKSIKFILRRHEIY